MSFEPIYVTKPHLPPYEEFEPLLKEIWSTRVLTNKGPFHDLLEKTLCEYLGVPFVSLFANGTVALTTALQALRISGEVITTPYSFVATSHSLLWNGIKPVFVDIDPKTYNLDPAQIEASISPQTTAIMPVHVYGTPCDVESIQQIADAYNLKVIYDAAHAFGVKQGGKSVLNFGDLSVLSFHATKVFNTFEGGAIVSQDEKTKRRIDHLKNFGFTNETTVVAPGINGKMSEFNAALGLVQIRHMSNVLEKRRRIAHAYDRALQGSKGLAGGLWDATFEGVSNYSYYPIRVLGSNSETRDEVHERLKRSGIFTRRYFYPLISDFPMYRGLPSARPANLPHATQAANEIICLPIYPDLTSEEQERIIYHLTLQS